MPTDDLGALIRSCQAGDRKALAELVRRFEGPVYAYLARMAPAVAEDACQETFARVFAALPRYRHRGRFRPWLFRLATSALVDAVRAARGAPGTFEPAALADLRPGPADSAVQGERGHRLDRALAHLPFEQRQVVILRTSGGLSFREIADALDRPIGTVLARMHRAVAALREELKKDGAP